MELTTVVGVVVIIVLAVVLLKFLGKAISFVFSLAGIVAVVWLVVIGLRWMDEGNVRDNFMESNNLFLLEDDGNLLTGFATQEGAPEPDLSEISTELGNPNSEVYDEYYKVIVVKKDSLPEKTAIMMDAVENGDKQNLFRYYVENGLLEGDDFVSTLVNKEKRGDLEVHKETLAFRHGISEVISS